MSTTITISSESIAEELNKLQVRNYDPSVLSPQGEYGIVFTNPAVYGLDLSSLHVAEDSSLLTMLASEEALGRDWNTPEEDEAWAHL